MSVIFFALGLCVGSFLNMAIYRTALQYGIFNFQFSIFNKKRSYCDFCGRQLKWYENVPVISWIIQKGKTRCCHNPLPWEYPIIETLTGIMFLLNFQFSIFNFQSILNYLIISLLIFSLVFDLKYMVLPDFATYSLITISIISIILGDHKGSPLQNIIAGLGALIFFFVLNRIKIRGSEAMGMGDVKYSLFMGLFLGWPNIIVAIYFAFVVGAVVSIILLIFKKVKKENPIPFGPFLIVGTIVAKIFGDKLINYFFGVILR